MVGVSLHSLSNTRQSARIAAAKQVSKTYFKMINALQNVKDELDVMAKTYTDINSLIKLM